MCYCADVFFIFSLGTLMLLFFKRLCCFADIKGNVTTWINHYLSIEFYVSVGWWLRNYWAQLRDFSFVLLSFTGLRCPITSDHGPFLCHLMYNKWEQYQLLALGDWSWRSIALLFRALNQATQKMWKKRCILVLSMAFVVGPSMVFVKFCHLYSHTVNFYLLLPNFMLQKLLYNRKCCYELLVFGWILRRGGWRVLHNNFCKKQNEKLKDWNYCSNPGKSHTPSSFRFLLINYCRRQRNHSMNQWSIYRWKM